jgi:hypothetical protein
MEGQKQTRGGHGCQGRGRQPRRTPSFLSMGRVFSTSQVAWPWYTQRGSQDAEQATAQGGLGNPPYWGGTRATAVGRAAQPGRGASGRRPAARLSGETSVAGEETSGPKRRAPLRRRVLAEAWAGWKQFWAGRPLGRRPSRAQPLAMWGHWKCPGNGERAPRVVPGPAFEPQGGKGAQYKGAGRAAGRRHRVGSTLYCMHIGPNGPNGREKKRAGVRTGGRCGGQCGGQRLEGPRARRSRGVDAAQPAALGGWRAGTGVWEFKVTFLPNCVLGWSLVAGSCF